VLFVLLPFCQLSITTVHFSAVSHYNSTVQQFANCASHCLHLQYISVHRQHCCGYGPHYVKQFLVAVRVINLQASAVECPTDRTSTFTHEASWSGLPSVIHANSLMTGMLSVTALDCIDNSVAG